VKRLVSIVLLTGLLLSMFSCSDTEVKAPAQTETVTTEAETIEDDYVHDDLPDTDFDGATMNILTTIWYDAPTYIYAENLNGEVINDALYNARMTISNRFNANIALTAKDNFDVVSNNVHNMVLAGDNTYDLVYNHDLKTVSNALKGDFLNIRDIDVIDFSKPWWKGSSEEFTVNGKLLFTANFLSLSGIYMNCSLAINKKIAADNLIEIPYEKVKAGDWYLDDLINMTKDMVRDLDGDGEITDKDQFGFLTSYYGEMAIQSDLGGTLISKDSYGYLVYEPDLDKIVRILEKVEKLYENGTSKYGATNEYGADLFMNNQGLFMFTENRILYTKVRNSNVIYGILPFPKFDETQKDYRSAGYDIYWGIPITVLDRKEMIGTLVTAMSCYNYNTIVPQVWEIVLGNKLADAPEDAEMFKIIRDVQYVDLGYAFSESAPLTDLIFLINKTNSNQVISFIEKRAKSLDKLLERINKSFDDIG